MNIFTKFHKDWTTIVDFLLIAKFWASLKFACTPSTRKNIPTLEKSTTLICVPSMYVHTCDEKSKKLILFEKRSSMCHVDSFYPSVTRSSWGLQVEPIIDSPKWIGIFFCHSLMIQCTVT